MSPKYPGIKVKLSGEDGNTFVIVGRVRGELRKGGVSNEEIQEFTRQVFTSKSYDEALSVVLSWVEVE